MLTLLLMQKAASVTPTVILTSQFDGRAPTGLRFDASTPTAVRNPS